MRRRWLGGSKIYCWIENDRRNWAIMAAERLKQGLQRITWPREWLESSRKRGHEFIAPRDNRPARQRAIQSVSHSGRAIGGASRRGVGFGFRAVPGRGGPQRFGQKHAAEYFGRAGSANVGTGASGRRGSVCPGRARAERVPRAARRVHLSGASSVASMHGN